MLWQVGIGGTLAIAGTNNPDVAWISENAAWIALFFMCFYICAYAWSWGPLPWLYAAEVQFLETRSAGQSIATLINLLFSFVIGQASALLLYRTATCVPSCQLHSIDATECGIRAHTALLIAIFMGSPTCSQHCMLLQSLQQKCL